MESSSAVMCTHTVQLHCFPCGNSFSSQAGPEPDGPERGQLTPCPSAGWKGPLSRVYPPFLSEESFPALVGIGRVPFPGYVRPMSVASNQVTLIRIDMAQFYSMFDREYHTTHAESIETLNSRSFQFFSLP